MTHDPREALEPCPFCGGEAKIFSYRTSEDSEGVHVECIKYGVRTDATDDAYADRLTAVESNASVEAIELAYGLLWVVGCDRSTRGGNALYLARKALLEQLDRAGQGRGITAARKVLNDEKAGCGGVQYSVSGRVSPYMDDRAGIRPGDTGACDPASGGVASLHNDWHPEGAARPDGLSVEARLREAILASIDMIENCAGVPTNPDSLPQMVKVYLQQAISVGDEAKIGNTVFCGHSVMASICELCGDEAKKSEGGPLNWQLSDDAKARIAEIDANRRHAALNAGNIVAGSPTPSDPPDRREIVARALMEKWPGDYAWGDETREPNELAFETADAILAALDGGR